MAVGDVENVTGGLGSIITEIGSIALWLQTLGIIVVLWIIFEIIAFWFNRKRMQEVYKIKHDMKRIERKIDKILKQKE